MAEQVEVFVHAGAHRTGTSSFQMCLDENAEGLRAAGYDLAYPGRDGIPGGKLKMKLPSPRHGRGKAREFIAPARAQIDKLRQGRARLILSEENIPGRMLHFTQGRFYPARENRLRVLREALPGPVAHLVYVLRPYDELFVSAYRKRAEDIAVEPFSFFVPGLMSVTDGWPDLMAAFRDLLHPARITVVTYAARGSSRDLLARLVPNLDADGLSEPDRQLNLSPTDAALEELQRRYHAGETLDKTEFRAVMERHAANRDSLGLAAFSDADRARLKARYASDLARLRAMPGITLIETTAA